VSRERFRDEPLPILWESQDGVSASQNCFADEIAIDFPSVGALVPRVRDAFLGEPEKSDTLTTEVSLSRRDASRGVVLPLEVPLRGTCVRCGGRGEIWTEPCGGCCGTGDSLVHRLVRLPVPAGVAHGARFRFRVSSPHAEPVRVEVRVAIRSSAA
jgi:hypothetical protein